MPVLCPVREGLARGLTTYTGAQLTQDLTLEADVAIIGSGAGGGTTAEILSAAGYKVLLIEEGPLKTSHDFNLLEDQAYTSLYQERSEEHTSELQSLMRNSYAVFCLKKKNKNTTINKQNIKLNLMIQQKHK